MELAHNAIMNCLRASCLANHLHGCDLRLARGHLQSKPAAELLAGKFNCSLSSVCALFVAQNLIPSPNNLLRRVCCLCRLVTLLQLTAELAQQQQQPTSQRQPNKRTTKQPNNNQTTTTAAAKQTDIASVRMGRKCGGAIFASSGGG